MAKIEIINPDGTGYSMPLESGKTLGITHGQNERHEVETMSGHASTTAIITDRRFKEDQTMVLVQNGELRRFKSGDTEVVINRRC